MAKKKLTHRTEESKQAHTQPQENHDQKQSTAAMDDPSEKLQSLKYLNDRLVKETLERRQEVDSLTQAKQALEIDLTRNRKEKENLVGELSEASERIFRLELERNVVCDGVQTHVEEMGDKFCSLMEERGESERVKHEREAEIRLLKDEMKELVVCLGKERDKLREVCSERDEMRAVYNGLVEEAGELRGKAVEMEKNERLLLHEVKDLKVKCEGLLVERAESEVAKETLLKEKDLVQRMFDESVAVTEDLKRKIDQIVEEKHEIEEEKKGFEMKIKNLEREMKQLTESVLSFTKEKVENAERISDLERRIGEAMEKEKAMRREADILALELQKKERDIEMLTAQRDSIEKNLNLVQEESKNLQHRIEMITEEKIATEEAKVKAERIVVELQRESSNQKDVMTTLTKSREVEKLKNEELLSEMSLLKDALEKVTVERSDAQKNFIDEKKKVENLILSLSDKEKRIEEAMDELGKMKIAQENSLNMKKEMEKEIEMLKNERDSMVQNLSEAQCEIDDLRAKVHLGVTNSERALELLKNTSLVVCDNHENGEVEASEHKFAEEIQPFVEGLDAIKTSFINKKKMVDEMKQLLEAAQAMEQGKKNYFTLTAAVTTILAAVSAVYVTRGR